jgi:hypothetical protein
MPANSAQYQRDYRDRTKRQYKDVSVRLSVADHRELKAYGASNGMGLATVLREGALAQIRGSALRATGVEAELKELRFLVASIANNVNQMAHHSNVVRHVVDEGGALAKLQELEALIEGFVDDKLTPR